MQNRRLHSIWGWVALTLGACASSAIESNDAPTDDTDTMPTTDDVTDDGTVDQDAGGDDGKVMPRDAAIRDARAGDASTSDPGSLLDGGDAGGTSKDAGTPTKDAATPPKDASVPDAAQSTPDAGPPPLMCTGNTGTACSGQCVDLRSDASNCGNCGKKCAATETCTSSACVAAAPPQQVPANCSAKMYNGHTYGICTQTREWSDARSSCISAGLDLAIINDANENNFIKGVIGADSWLGMGDQDHEGTYVDVVPGNGSNTNGQGQSYFNWNDSEPSNSQSCDGLNIFITCLGKKSDEDCIEVYQSSGKWNDELCTRSHAYVCESY